MILWISNRSFVRAMKESVKQSGEEKGGEMQHQKR